MRAWREFQAALAQHPDDLLSEVVMGLINGFFKGEADGGHGRLKTASQNAMNKIKSTWEEVEKIGAKYGAAL